MLGLKGGVDGAKGTIVKKIELLSREVRRKSEKRKVESIEKFTILEIQGTLLAIEKKYGDMKIHFAGNEIIVDGDPADIENAFQAMYTECEKIEPVEFNHNQSREWVNFLQKEQTVKYIQEKLKQKHLFGIWNIDATVLRVFVPDKECIEKIKSTLLEAILEESVPVDKSSTDLLTSEWWGDFLLGIRNTFQDKIQVCTKGKQEVVIVGTDDVLPHVKNLVMTFFDEKTVTIQCEPVVCEFISKFWTQDDFAEIQKYDVIMKIKANSLELRGLSDNLNKCRKKLDKKRKRMCSEQRDFQEINRNVRYRVTDLEAAKHSGAITTIEKECKCVIKLPHDIDKSLSVTLRDYAVIDSEILEENLQNSSTNTSPKCFQTGRHNIKIQLILGEIAHQKVEIIVVGAPSNLSRRCGSASNFLLNLGGPQLQTDFNKLYPDGILDGEVAVIDSVNLNWDKIYFTSLPSWEEARCDGGKVFRNFMRECLRLADRYDKKTMAFSIMDEDLGYPKDIAASIMYGAVVEFDSSYNKTTLKEINFVMDNEYNETIKAFEDHEYMRIYGASSRGTLNTYFVGGRIKIELVTEELSTQKVDAILCFVSPDMNLTRSAVCKSLVQNGGNSLQGECEHKYKNKLDFKKVARISGGKLSCKTVLLTVLPTYTEHAESNSVEQSLITTLQRVFKKANSNGYKSIAIPAIETGYLNYPRAIAAKCMYDAAVDWANKNPNVSLNVVRFVMYDKDAEAQQAYRVCHLKTQGRETRAKRTFLGDGTVLIKPDNGYRMVKDGCAIGPIQLQVQVGDLQNSTADAIVNENMLPENDLKNDGVVITGSVGLKAKYVIHVLFKDSLPDLRKQIVACLEEASKKSIISIAFPIIKSVVGAEAKTFPADEMGECLFAAIDDFTSQNPESSLTSVRLVVPDSNAVYAPAIFGVLQAKVSAVNSQWGMGIIFKSNLGSMTKKLEYENKNSAKPKNKSKQQNPTVTISVHSDAKINIDRCFNVLADRIHLEYAKKVVDADIDVIGSLTDKQIHSIIDSDIVVNIEFDKQAGRFIIVGPLRNVLAAVTCLQNKLRRYKRKETNRNFAKVLYDKTRWHWLRENEVASEKEVPYDMMPNFIIETAYKEGKQTVELQSKDGKIYVIDLHKLVEYPKRNVSDTVMVIRKDILKGSPIILPTVWETLGTNENVKRVVLVPGAEYNKVKTKFMKEVSNAKISRSVQLVQIERIQNKTLYQQYAAKNKLMEQQNSGCKQIERQLWHETAKENIHRIVKNGFHRSYCGVHGVAYGQGVYFAADAFQSTQPYPDGNKSGAKRHVFLARVLTGELIKGKPSLRVLPPVNPDQPTVMYDSAVDDVNNPKEFVVFRDTQAYPEFLITYIIED